VGDGKIWRPGYCDDSLKWRAGEVYHLGLIYNPKVFDWSNTNNYWGCGRGLGLDGAGIDAGASR
jgi:hypothetical protein